MCGKLRIVSQIIELAGYVNALCLSTIDLELSDWNPEKWKELFLSTEEQRYVGKLKSEKRKKEFILGRIAAKGAINMLSGNPVPFQHMTISSGVFNQPIVKSVYVHNINVSISHSTKRAYALAFPEEFPCGIDAETYSKKSEETVYKVLSEEEKNLLATANITPLLVWTAKESLSKILKTGLSLDLSKMEIKEVKKNNECYIGKYTDWVQYDFFSLIGEEVVTITLPRNVFRDLNQVKKEIVRIL